MPQFLNSSSEDAVHTPEDAGEMALLPHLKTHAFTQGLSDSDLAELARIAVKVTFEENEVVLYAGQCSDAFYLLLSGSVAIELRANRYSVCVQPVHPGEVFGWSALLDHQETTFQVRARESSTALRIDGAALSALCRSHPQLGVEVMARALKVVAGRVKATEAAFAEMFGMKI